MSITAVYVGGEKNKKMADYELKVWVFFMWFESHCGLKCVFLLILMW